jgi:prolipoprotein diacylglyceryl transferase
MIALSIPSPSHNAIHIGPLAIHAYALCIVVGIVVALIVSERRWVARGGKAGQMQDLALWAVPLGIIGGRIYHVITDHDLYFGNGHNPWNAFAIWNGGMGVWGSIPLGALGVILGARHMKVRLWPLLDTIAPTVLLAQGIGRWGNWFNQELFGRPTDLPWGLQIDPSHWPAGKTFATGTTFHPAFLYECLWDVAMFFVVVWAERRFRLGFGRTTALYVMTYCVGRFFVETLRIDDVELHDVLGLRWSDWMAVLLFVAGLAYFVWSAVRHPGREESVYRDDAEDADVPTAETTS